MPAHQRDVGSSANASLEGLSELTMNVFIDKSLEASAQGKESTKKQEMYAATDATTSLEIYEVFKKKPDLKCRLKEDEAYVDPIPLNRSIICMAT